MRSFKMIGCLAWMKHVPKGSEAQKLIILKPINQRKFVNFKCTNA